MIAAVSVGDGVELCVETMGDAGAPALVLIAGAAASMDWWDDELCRRLAARGRRVVRFDHRDTGRSTTWPPGAPGYTADDLVADVVALLDALGIARAHLVGISMGAAIAQRLALEHRNRVATLALLSTTSIGASEEPLPGMSDELRAAFAEPGRDPDWTDRDAVIEHLVAGERRFSSPRDFDEARVRTVAARVVDRSRDVAAGLTNHWLLEAGDAARPGPSALRDLPTLVLHGTADPLFPVEHGRALAAEIEGARLVELDGVGHQVPPPRTWDLVVDELVALGAS